MKFEFTSNKKPRAICRDVGEIANLRVVGSYDGPSLDFETGGRTYSAWLKVTAARLYGFLNFAGGYQDGDELNLPEPPESGILDDWRTPDVDGRTAICADPRILRAYILYFALDYRKTKTEINAILADVPTRAEALEWLKANRFPTEPLDDEAAWKRVREAEDAREFEDYIFDPRQLLTEDF